MEREKYYVLIDESGDLGFQKGTQWFVLTGVIIKASDEPLIRERLRLIRTKLNLDKIHLREIREFNKKAFVASSVSDLPFVYTNVLIDTMKFDTVKIDSPFTAYNYACRYLLERVSWYLRDNNGSADIILSARGTKRDTELVNYIKDKLLDYDGNNIAEWTITRVIVKTAGEWEMLQLADICATSTFLTYQVNQWGFRLPCFSRRLQDHLYRHRGKLKNYGLKFFTEEMTPDVIYMKNSLICEECPK